MKQKLIKINAQHYVIVDDSEIKEGDVFIHSNKILERASRDLDGRGLYKVLHSILPVPHPSCCVAKDGGLNKSNQSCAYRNQCLDIPSITLEDVEEAVHGYSLIDKDKLFTIENLRNIAYYAIQIGINTNIAHRDKAKGLLYEIPDSDTLIESFILKLLPKEWDVEIIDGKIKLL